MFPFPSIAVTFKRLCKSDASATKRLRGIQNVGWVRVKSGPVAKVATGRSVPVEETADVRSIDDAAFAAGDDTAAPLALMDSDDALDAATEEDAADTVSLVPASDAGAESETPESVRADVVPCSDVTTAPVSIDGAEKTVLPVSAKSRFPVPVNDPLPVTVTRTACPSGTRPMMAAARTATTRGRECSHCARRPVLGGRVGMEAIGPGNLISIARKGVPMNPPKVHKTAILLPSKTKRIVDFSALLGGNHEIQKTSLRRGNMPDWQGWSDRARPQTRP